MSEEVKFTEEELGKINSIRENYLNIQNSFGQGKMAKMRLNQQEQDLENNLNEIQSEESKFLEEITKKYGQGTLNPETGVFTKNKSE